MEDSVKGLTFPEFHALAFLEKDLDPCVEGQVALTFTPDVFSELDALEARGLTRDEECPLCIGPYGGPAIHVNLTDLGKLAISLVRSGVIVLTA